MIEIGKTLISTELLEEHFVCDLNKCKGECCIAGDYGAPLDKSELKEIEKYYPIVKPLLQKRALKDIEEQGLYVKDDEGDWVTPLINGNEECAFTIFENGIAKCAFEKAYYDMCTSLQIRQEFESPGISIFERVANTQIRRRMVQRINGSSRDVEGGEEEEVKWDHSNSTLLIVCSNTSIIKSF